MTILWSEKLTLNFKKFAAKVSIDTSSLQADLENGVNLEQTIRLREEIAEQHRARGQMKDMAAKYGYDISGPATNAQEAIQWTYFGYLAAVKSQNGAAMSNLSVVWASTVVPWLPKTASVS